MLEVMYLNDGGTSLRKSKTWRVELLVIEMTLNNERWFYCGLYQQPIVKNASIGTVLESLIGRL